MIRLVIFDLDGVLIDAKEIHYESLNKALIDNHQFAIHREDHLKDFDGLNTEQKLVKLNYKGELKEKIKILKQKYTIKAIKQLPVNEELYRTLEELSKTYKICVASNSINDTVKHALISTKLIDFVDFYYSNEDVKNPKPHPEIYLQCMVKAGVSPKETLIIEDSYNGRLGAEQTGAFVMGVNSPKDVNVENIQSFLSTKENTKNKWKDPKLNILIPMSGKGSRFADAGFAFPKPLIEVHGKPMIQAVIENLNIEANYIFVVQKEHYEKYNLKTLLNLITPNCKIITVDGITEGAACTALLAKEFINNDNPLLIANSDQIVEWNSGEFMYSMMGDYIDGGIVTFKATHPKWSFVKLNESGFVTEVAEKNPISDNATVGIYFWKKGKNFVDHAQCMINGNKRVNNEFYIAPVFNQSIEDGFKIKSYQVEKMWGIGDPPSLDIFIREYKKSI